MSTLYVQVNCHLTSINCTLSQVLLPNAYYHFVKRTLSIRKFSNNCHINPHKKYGMTNLLLEPRTISFNQDNINSCKSIKCFSVGGYNWRASIVDGRTTDEGKDLKEGKWIGTDSNKGKWITKIEDIQDEPNSDWMSAKKETAIKLLNKRVIEKITENVDKIASKYFTEEQRKTLFYILKSNLVATALHDKAEIQMQINEKSRLLMAKTARETKKVPKFTLSKKIESNSRLKLPKGPPDCRISSIVFPDLNSLLSKPKEKVEFHEIIDDRLVKISESADNNKQKENIKVAVENNEINKKSD